MNKVLAIIAGVAILGALFCPGSCANPYDVTQNKLKHGIPVEVILKYHHNLVIHNRKLVTSVETFNVRAINDTHIIKDYRAQVC